VLEESAALGSVNNHRLYTSLRAGYSSNAVLSAVVKCELSRQRRQAINLDTQTASLLATDTAASLHGSEKRYRIETMLNTGVGKFTTFPAMHRALAECMPV